LRATTIVYRCLLIFICVCSYSCIAWGKFWAVWLCNFSDSWPLGHLELVRPNKQVTSHWSNGLGLVFISGLARRALLLRSGAPMHRVHRVHRAGGTLPALYPNHQCRGQEANHSGKEVHLTFVMSFNPYLWCRVPSRSEASLPPPLQGNPNLIFTYCVLPCCNFINPLHPQEQQMSSSGSI
jgi:hypothetical protein